jgi:hypothetical protein
MFSLIFKIFTEVKIEIVVFLVMAPCSFVGGNRNLG